MLKIDMVRYYEDTTMSVTELIAELQKIPDPDNTPVITEGCDCDGNVFEVTVVNGHAYLNRKD